MIWGNSTIPALIQVSMEKLRYLFYWQAGRLLPSSIFSQGQKFVPEFNLPTNWPRKENILTLFTSQVRLQKKNSPDSSAVWFKVRGRKDCGKQIIWDTLTNPQWKAVWLFFFPYRLIFYLQRRDFSTFSSVVLYLFIITLFILHVWL